MASCRASTRLGRFRRIVTATDVDAVILTPFVHDVLSEIGGKLDANLSADT